MFDCMYTLSCPPHYTYLTLPALLYVSMEYVCYGSCTFLSLPFFAYVEEKIIRDFSNGILIMNFVFVSRFAFRQNRVRKLVMDVFSIGAKMDLQISVIRMRIARRRC